MSMLQSYTSKRRMTMSSCPCVVVVPFSQIGDLHPGAGIGVEAWPCCDEVEEGIAWAGSGRSLTMSNEPVVAGNVSTANAAVDETLKGELGSGIGDTGGEGTEDAGSDGLVVVWWGMSSLTTPSATFVGKTTLTNAEVVANISPAIAIHVPALDVTHLLGAGSLGGAEGSGCVVNHHEGGWNVWEGSGIGTPSSPLSTSDDRGAG